jgi:DUF4097 and DUF4098 domain-containing protein YvlB
MEIDQMQNQLDEGRMSNSDPREQRSHQPSYNEGAYRKPGSGMARNLILTFILLVLIGTGAAFWGLVQFKDVAALPAHTFQVAGHARLIVNNTSGKINIHSGKTDSIVVQATKYARGFNASANDVQVNYQQQGDTVSVTSDETWSFLSERGVNLDITVPSTTDLKVENTSGNIDIEQVSGKIEAQTKSGDVEASALSGNVQLSTTSGDIHLENANGTMQLSTVSGGIKADNIQLHGESSLMTTSGGIKFEGTLDPRGSYRMKAVSGDIDVILPSNVAFKLDASTTSGDVHNEFGSTTVGIAPQPALTLHTTSGRIEVRKQ